MATRNITKLNGEYIARRFISTGRRPDGIKVINKTGSAIAADKLVSISGYDSTSKLLKVVLADPTLPSSADVWVTLAPMANNTADFIAKGHFSAASLDTSGFNAVGDPVYLSNTAGGFSVTPANPGSAIVVGYVHVKSSTVGQILWDIQPTTLGSAASAASGTATGSGVLVTTGTISSANITGTSAGQLGHANGVILVPAGGTHVINQLVSAVVINAFNTAAYTGGGNTSINIGGGGAALTGVAAAASFITSAANKVIEFVPLAATFNTYTENNSLNLVSAAAPTQPGTAAGVFRYVVAYRQITTGL